MSIIETEIWPRVREYIILQKVPQDKSVEHREPRIRIEVGSPPEPLKSKMLALLFPCVYCGAEIHPFRARFKGGRERKDPKHLYMAVTCAPLTNYGCSRSKAASVEYRKIQRDVEAHRQNPKPPTTPVQSRFAI